MVKFNDYIGNLITGINQARVMADIESARIAQAYANDEILKNFPIPHFRAQDIELDIPIAIESFDELPIKEYQPLDNKSFNSHTYTSMKNEAKVNSFSRNTSKHLNKLIAENSRRLEADLKANMSKETAFQHFEEKMGEAYIIALEKENIKSKDLKQTELDFKKNLKERLYKTIENRKHSNTLENANVIVEASKLREIPTENIVRIKMKLFEDGMEWHTSQDENGNINTSLLPE